MTGVDAGLRAADHFARHYHLGWDYKNVWANQAGKYIQPTFFKATQKAALEGLASFWDDLNWLVDFAAAQRLLNV